MSQDCAERFFAWSGVTAESLSKVKPAFAKDGTTHAGNASQVSDGAAAVLLARRSVAHKLGLPILGKFVTAAVVGVPREFLSAQAGHAQNERALTTLTGP